MGGGGDGRGGGDGWGGGGDGWGGGGDGVGGGGGGGGEGMLLIDMVPYVTFKVSSSDVRLRRAATLDTNRHTPCRVHSRGI